MNLKKDKKKDKITKKELDFILQQGEGYNVEFKESIEKSIIRTIVAFANIIEP